MNKEAIPLSLYIHIPWCVHKCPYCDFNSHEFKGSIPEDEYIKALIADLEQELPLIWGRRVNSIFIGGGTPSVFSGSGIQKLLSAVRERLVILPNAEITMEANPGTVDAEHFSAYKEAGVNRLSIGVQSFNDEHLKSLQRIHDREMAEQAVAKARQAGITNINLDLMYGLPNQTIEQAQTDIKRAIELQPAHLSHYQLTLEPNTAFFQNPPVLPDDEHRWKMQSGCQHILKEAGFVQYEISAYARHNKYCEHNLNYWQFGDYVGIGAGAHGKITLPSPYEILRKSKYRHPKQYCQGLQSGHFVSQENRIEQSEMLLEFMMNVLRLNEGVATELLLTRTGCHHNELMSAASKAIEAGLLMDSADRICATEKGHLFLNDLLAYF